jgi:hypothetical protein
VFSLISRLVALLILIVGLMELAMGYAIATGFIGPYEQALARYTTASSSGELINRAIILIAIALALGTLAEIGLAVRKQKVDN